MKKIRLTQDKFALVDNEDFVKVNRYRWWLFKNKNDLEYATCRINGKITLMHRFILGNSSGVLTDHVNRNGLDNRRKNLRFCNASENGGNRRININNPSGFKGVCKNRKKWRTLIKVNGKSIHLGSYDNPIEAAKAYDEGARKYFGNFARLNFI